MGLINIIMGLIIFILIGGVIVYLLIFSMKKKRTKWLMAMLILLIIGYLSAVVMTAYKQQYINGVLPKRALAIIHKYCGKKSYVITKSKEPFNSWSAFYLQNYLTYFLKYTILSDPQCFTAIIKADAQSNNKKVIYIYDEEADQIIYRIEKLPTK